MKLNRITTSLVVALGLVVMSAGDALAQTTPTITAQQVGNAVRLQWTAIPQATHYVLEVTGSLNGEVTIPTTFVDVTGIPAGNYSVRVRAAAGNISGPFSAPVAIVIGGAPAGPCGSLGAPAINVSTSGNVLNLNWNEVSGAIGYRIQVGTAPGATQYTLDVGPNQRSFSVPVPYTGTFYVRVLAGNVCGNLAASNEASFTIGATTPGPGPTPPTGGSGPRTPDPAPGQRLPLPSYGQAVVNAIGAAYPGALHNSCGNNEWLFRVVAALRQYDSRWGLNWKRGNRGDMSQDVVTYHWGSGPDEDSTQVYIIDVIGSHCPGPGDRSSYPTWGDVTQKTVEAGTIGRWTLQPYLRAGFPADVRP